jgi:hypothetical protein
MRHPKNSTQDTQTMRASYHAMGQSASLPPRPIYARRWLLPACCPEAFDRDDYALTDALDWLEPGGFR